MAERDEKPPPSEDKTRLAARLSADYMLRSLKMIGELAQGELLWIGAAGAYGSAMASNYNTRLRAPEVLVTGDRYDVIRVRETYDQLLANERISGDPTIAPERSAAELHAIDAVTTTEA